MRLPRPHLRLSSTVATAKLRSTLHSRISSHYVKSGDTASASRDLATQELRWLEEGAKERSGIKWPETLRGMVSQLVEENKPLAYILGNHPFHPLRLPLLVRPPTLIPRPETEHWLAHLSSLLLASSSPPATPFRILDIGTGTGCIPLALVQYLREADWDVRALGVDVGPDALVLARENVARAAMAERVRISRGNLFAQGFEDVVRAASDGRFDLVVSNPPYITRSDYELLPPSVKEWEDRGALVGEAYGCSDERDDGLVFYRRIVAILDALLVEDASDVSAGRPVVAFEVGEGQAGDVASMLRHRGMRTEVVKDQWDIERLVMGSRSGM